MYMLHNLSNLTLRNNTQYTVLIYPYNKLKFHLMYNIISYLIKSIYLSIYVCVFNLLEMDCHMHPILMQHHLH